MKTPRGAACHHHAAPLFCAPARGSWLVFGGGTRGRYHAAMTGLPVILNLADRVCVVVGGGPVAQRRCAALLEAGASVRVVAPELADGFDTSGIEHHARPFEPDDLKDALLVVAATDDPQVNREISEAANERGVLVNRSDDAAAGDLIVPAQGQRGPIRITVDTGGRSASAARQVRDELLDALDGQWVQLLEVVGRYREVVQEKIDDPKRRQALLKRFITDDARATLLRDGEDALTRCFERWIQEETEAQNAARSARSE